MGEREVCLKTLTTALNTVTETMEPPEQWKTSNTVLIPKVKKPKVSDFRPIALTNTGYKLYMSMVKAKLVEHMQNNGKINEFQSGFTRGKRMEDNLLLLRYCIDSSLAAGR